MFHETVHLQSYATFFCHSVILSLPVVLLLKLPTISSAMHLQDYFAESATTITISTFAKFGDLDKILPKLSYLPQYVKINYRQCFAVFVLVCISRHTVSASMCSF